MQLAKRLLNVKPSETLAITNRVLEMKRAGEDVIGLGAGEPDFDTPEHIRQAAIDAINEGHTRYTHSTGIPELKQAIVDRLRINNNLEYRPEEIIVSCGGKHVLVNAVLAICEEGDEVIIPSPYWVSYPHMVHLAGAKPVLMPTDPDRGFAIDLNGLRDAITPRTKAILFCNPVNPTGAVYTSQETDELVEVLRETQAVIITDELYDSMTYDGVKVRSLGTYPELKHRVITVNGVSKSYAMTGWRIGYGAGPVEYISQMSKIQSHMTSNPTSVSQWAAVTALNGPQDCVAAMVKVFKQRRDYVYDILIQMEGIKCQPCLGTFYMFPDVSRLLGRRYGDRQIVDSFDLCNYLLEEEKVALVPGNAFGSPNHVRISFAASMDHLEKAMVRIQDGLLKLG
jgi:aspartate aminotransferase